MSPENLIYFGIKRSKFTVASLCRSSDRTQYCRWLHTQAEFGFLAAVDTGFSLRHLPAADAAADRRFFHAWSFVQSADGKSMAGVGYGTFVSAGCF